MDSSTTTALRDITNLYSATNDEKAVHGTSTNTAPILPANEQESEPEPKYLGTWQMLPISIAMGLAVLILGLDNTIVGTATPTITNEFHSLTDIGWYGSAYRVTTCSTQFFYGKIYEQFRVKWVFTTAVAILVIGSIISAAAPSSTSFIIGRAVAGCGASGIVTGVFITISHSIPMHLRPIYNSTVGALECVGMVIAPVIGGALTTYANWRWCFWLNVPVGGFTIAVIIVLFKNPENEKCSDAPISSKLKQLNIPNLFVFTGSIVCLLLALEWGGTTYNWSSGRIIALLVVSGIAFMAFIAMEVLQKSRSTIPSSVVLKKTVALCVLYAFCASAAFSVIDYFLPIWFQAIKNASAAQSGVMLIPSIIGLSVAAFSSGFIISLIIGYYTPVMLLGSILIAIGSSFLTTFSPTTGQSAWIGWQIMVGFGIGLSISQPWSAVQTVLSTEDIPSGMTAISFAISIGAALSISISQNIFTNLLRQRLSGIPGVYSDSIVSQGVTEILQSVPVSERAQVIEIYNFAVTRTFWICVAMACVGLVAALAMDWNSIKGKKEEAGDK